MQLLRPFRSLLRVIYQLLIWGADSCVYFGLRMSAPAPGKVVLLVRLDLVGDFVLWAEHARLLRAHYANMGYRVVLACHAGWADLAQNEAVADALIPIQCTRLLTDLPYRYRMLRHIKALGAQIAIQPTVSRKLPLGDSLIRFSMAPERIGTLAYPGGQERLPRAISNRWYSRLIDNGQGRLHELDANARFVAHLLGGVPTIAAPRLRGQAVAVAAVAGLGPFIVLSLGASWAGKRWDVAQFVQLAQWLKQIYGLPLVLCGAAGEKPLAVAFAQQFDGEVCDLVGQTSLPECVALFARATLVIGNDSGAIHLAAAVGTPSICLTGGGHFGRFVPYPTHLASVPHSPKIVAHKMDCYGCNWSCIYPRQANEAVVCVRRIPLDAVKQAVSDCLAEERAPIVPIVPL